MVRLFAVMMLGLAAAGVAPAQASFDVQGPPCLYTFPTGCGSLGDPEEVAGNGLALATVDVTNGAGMPCGGTGYARIDAHNPGAINPTAGGPQPGDGIVNEVYIPIPLGAVTMSLCWDFYNGEGGPSSGFNDGMAIEIASAGCGPAITTLAYADTFSALGAGVDSGASSCATLASEMAPNGPQVVGPLSLPAGAAFLRVKVWNGGDDSATSHAAIDEVAFTLAPVCTLAITAPLGPGSIAIVNSGCNPGDWYITAVTLAPGLFPNGWFFGLDITWAELVSQASLGAPFSGVLGPAGDSVFFIPGGVPAGIDVFAVTATFQPGFGANTFATAPVAFVTP
jgi:hypothetical protein